MSATRDGELLSRRVVLPLPLALFALPLGASATDGLDAPDGSISDKFGFVKDGEVKQLTEIEARNELTKKMQAATAAGKGLDVERRGQFNEKALFSEDFYFKYGLRPTPEDMKAKPLEEIPFVPVQRRYTGYKKYDDRMRQGFALYANDLRTLIQDGKWAEVGAFLEIGSKGKGSNAQGEGTGVAASPMRSSCRAFGLFANTVLQSENDNGATQANLLVRHFVNELYFSLDDIAAAAKSGNKADAKQAWTRGRDYINAYLEIVNRPINAKVGDKYPVIEESI
eukprot:CAMPEP_0115860320 /NCGR_PEP_ID=MMETSP0287-20121206/17064_1 /TAXON_ID=412157 /ORGANISM="Chrysochromulina rotalis, Strain UIO044" /LENGTH=281 /DNA_ID=CAMNT_0003314635 /DNA_START=37 /DNA_END=882 /DNA_ORIENTATION=-